MTLAGRVAIVTGAGRGIGRAVAGAFAGEGQRDGAADTAARARDHGHLAAQLQITSPPRDLISSMNSARVSGRSRKEPSMAEVTAFEFCFSTPRMSMHR